MRYETIEFRNFASYGNKDQVIDLRGPAGFFLILGKNGAGKSTISDAIKFGTYGKVDKKSLKDLANRSNKNGWVRLTIDSKGRKIVSERTVMPNGMELSIDGQPYDKANYSGRGPNEYLCEELLDIPFYVFTNVISLNINDFKSFMSMGAKDKREIVDRVLGYSILNEMKEILGKSSKSLKDSIDSLHSKLQGAKVSLDSSMAQLEETMKKLQENNDEEIADVVKQLESFKNLLNLQSEKVKEFRIRKEEVEKEANKYLELITKARGTVKYANDRLKLFDNNQCPECGAGLDSEYHVSLKHGLEKDRDVAAEEEAKLIKEAKAVKEKRDAINQEERDLMDKGSKIQSKISGLNTMLKNLESNKNSTTSTEGLRNVIARVGAEMKEWADQRAIDEEKLAWNKVVEEAVSENGIKKLVMQRIIPAFNNEIYSMMLQMHLDYQVTFDENFDAKLYHLGEEISPATLSFGESKKVDFVILVAWIRLMKMKFPTLNLLFLDEIFSSVDQDGIHSILQILNKLCHELDLNIFVISHNPLPQEVFDYKIEIEKKDGFSNLRIEKA